MFGDLSIGAVLPRLSSFEIAFLSGRLEGPLPREQGFRGFDLLCLASLDRCQPVFLLQGSTIQLENLLLVAFERGKRKLVEFHKGGLIRLSDRTYVNRFRFRKINVENLKSGFVRNYSRLELIRWAAEAKSLWRRCLSGVSVLGFSIPGSYGDGK